MIKSITDSHRCMYRNARIRALDLSDRTTPIPFYDIIDDQIPTQDIGYEVRTDAAGYIFYSNGQHQVECLAIKQSAIIQVDLFNNNAWDIEWILHVDNDNDFVRVADVHKVYDKDNNLVWNPLTDDWHLPDWVERSELQSGEWAEGEMDVTDATPTELPLDKWTHTVAFMPNHASDYVVRYNIGRYGQTVQFVNASNTEVRLGLEGWISTGLYAIRTHTLQPLQSIVAAYIKGKGWFAAVEDPTIYRYTDNSVPLEIDLAFNKWIQKIVIEAVPPSQLVTLKWSGAAGFRIINIVNDTGNQLLVRGKYKIAGVEFTGPEYDSIEPWSSEVFKTKGDPIIKDANRSNYSAEARNPATFENDYTKVFYLNSWQGSIDITCTIYGKWIPIKVLLKQNDWSGTPGDTRTLQITINGTIVYTESKTYVANTHSAGELMLSMDVRLSKVATDPTDIFNLNKTICDVKAYGGSFA